MDKLVINVSTNNHDEKSDYNAVKQYLKDRIFTPKKNGDVIKSPPIKHIIINVSNDDELNNYVLK